MELADTQTLTNLREALDASSRGARRLIWFAEQADIEGYPEIAATFRAAAEVQAGHANGHLEYLAEFGDPDTGLPLNDTSEHLAAAIAAERQKAEAITPGYVEVAKGEGLGEIAEWFETVERAQQRVVGRLEAGSDSLR